MEMSKRMRVDDELLAIAKKLKVKYEKEVKARFTYNDALKRAGLKALKK